MSIIVEIFPLCDICGESFPDYVIPENTSKRVIREVMKQESWKRDKGKDICPDCWDYLTEKEKQEIRPE